MLQNYIILPYNINDKSIKCQFKPILKINLKCRICILNDSNETVEPPPSPFQYNASVLSTLQPYN